MYREQMVDKYMANTIDIEEHGIKTAFKEFKYYIADILMAKMIEAVRMGRQILLKAPSPQK